MTKQSAPLPSGPSLNRRQPLLRTNELSSNRITRAGAAEAAGKVTAECAAVCCCCPCALLDLLVLAVYRWPAGLCRKEIRRKRRGMLKKKGLPRKLTRNDTELVRIRDQMLPVSIGAVDATEPDKDETKLDKEMWEKFNGAGFWRNPFEKGEDLNTPKKNVS